MAWEISAMSGAPLPPGIPGKPGMEGGRCWLLLAAGTVGVLVAGAERMLAGSASNAGSEACPGPSLTSASGLQYEQQWLKGIAVNVGNEGCKDCSRDDTAK